MRILGVDPGLAITGYGIVDYRGNSFFPVTYGCLRSFTGELLYQRLKSLYDQLTNLLADYRPDCMAIEELFFNRNVRTAIAVGQARGVLLLAAAQAGIKVFEYTPLQVKQAVAGFGRAEKQQVQYMVKVIMNLPEVPRPDDVADALAVSICHANNHSSLGAFL
ncbi:crossover junction endodeoxyribonuclease RuvC [Desulfotruncus alcoholivorax]|uniref:crossover junction endodeoxyribonuclease RuvC n=1 Tax=Desulfotruncus alcoholivorax TaxID=265477 RepID=UPI0003FD11C4|nr:crossover junction endodeoxyribonuclease RuvC [Desulfotruncus alcoholivorax]